MSEKRRKQKDSKGFFGGGLVAWLHGVMIHRTTTEKEQGEKVKKVVKHPNKKIV